MKLCDECAETNDLRGEIENQVISQLKEELDNVKLSFTKAIEFATENESDDGMQFLRCWLEGKWDGCREWAAEYELHPAIFWPEKSELIDATSLTDEEPKFMKVDNDEQAR